MLQLCRRLLIPPAQPVAASAEGGVCAGGALLRLQATAYDTLAEERQRRAAREARLPVPQSAPLPVEVAW